MKKTLIAIACLIVGSQLLATEAQVGYQAGHGEMNALPVNDTMHSLPYNDKMHALPAGGLVPGLTVKDDAMRSLPVRNGEMRALPVGGPRRGLPVRDDRMRTLPYDDKMHSLPYNEVHALPVR